MSDDRGGPVTLGNEASAFADAQNCYDDVIGDFPVTTRRALARRESPESGENLALRLVAQAVERDPDDVLDLLGIAGCELADPDDHVEDVGEFGVVPDDAGLLGAFQERLAGGEQRCAAGLEQGGVRVEMVGQLGGERPLGREVAHQALEPAVERLPRIEPVELLGRARQLLDLIDVERLYQCLAIREVAVERADPDPGARSPSEKSPRRPLRTRRERPRAPSRSRVARRRAWAA